MLDTATNLDEFRLLLEELCCDLCRFEHVTNDRLAPEAVRIDREYWLAAPGAFADIRVAPAKFLPGGRGAAGRSLLVLELRPRHQRRRDCAREPDRLLLESALSNHQQRRDALPIRGRRSHRPVRHPRPSSRFHRRGPRYRARSAGSASPLLSVGSVESIACRTRPASTSEWCWEICRLSRYGRSAGCTSARSVTASTSRRVC